MYSWEPVACIMGPTKVTSSCTRARTSCKRRLCVASYNRLTISSGLAMASPFRVLRLIYVLRLAWMCKLIARHIDSTMTATANDDAVVSPHQSNADQDHSDGEARCPEVQEPPAGRQKGDAEKAARNPNRCHWSADPGQPREPGRSRRRIEQYLDG